MSRGSDSGGKRSGRVDYDYDDDFRITRNTMVLRGTVVGPFRGGGWWQD